MNPISSTQITYKDIECSLSYSYRKEFGGYYSEGITFKIPKTGKNFKNNEKRFFDSERQCISFLSYLTKKIIDNDFEFKEEDVLAYFLEEDSSISPKEREKILTFFINTKKEFHSKILELSSDISTEKMFTDSYGSVREELVAKRNIFEKEFENKNLRKNNESTEYLQWLSSQREKLYQAHMSKLTDLFSKKFNKNILSEYNKISERNNPNIHKITSRKGSDPIDWNDSKNVVIAILVVAIILFIFAFSSANQPSQHDKNMSEQAKKLYKDSGGKTIDCSGTVRENNSVCDYLMSLPDNSNLPEPSRPFP